MTQEERYEFVMKQTQKRLELAKKEIWTDIDRLEFLILTIQPYSRMWRYGMIKALRHAIKLMKKEEEEKE